MGWMIVGIVCIVLAAFVAVLLIRAAMFRPKPQQTPSQECVTLDEEKTVTDMQQLIRCKTVSYNDESLVDKEEFEKFQTLLPQL